jgi:hypothetical protein
MPPRCWALPIPDVASVVMSGFAFNQAIKPCRSFAGAAFFATIR